METIYALVIILTGTLVPNADAPDGVLSGEIENKTTIYYSSLETCESAYMQALESAEQMNVEDINGTVTVRPCEGIRAVQ